MGSLVVIDYYNRLYEFKSGLEGEEPHIIDLDIAPRWIAIFNIVRYHSAIYLVDPEWNAGEYVNSQFGDSVHRDRLCW